MTVLVDDRKLYGDDTDVDTSRLQYYKYNSEQREGGAAAERASLKVEVGARHVENCCSAWKLASLPKS